MADRKLSTRGEAILAGIAVLVVYVVLRPDALTNLGRLYDDGVYLAVGKAIAQGEGYRSIHLVGGPVQMKFPPLLPALYSLFWLSFDSLRAVTRLALASSIAAAAAGAALLWYYARTALGAGRVLTALFVIAPLLTARTQFYFAGPASEPWMLLGWISALVLVEHLRPARADGAEHARGDGAEHARHGTRRPVGTAIALGLVLAATTLARTQGIAIALAVLACLPLARIGWRSTSAAVAATVLPLFAWTIAHGAMAARGPLSPLPDQSSYTAWIPTGSVGEFADFAMMMLYRDTPLYLREYGPMLTGWSSTKSYALAAAVLLFAAVGMALLARRAPALVASLVTSVGVLLVWPYIQDRFLTPVLPVAGLAAAYAAARGVVLLPRAARAAVLVAAACVGLYVLNANLRGRYEAVANGPGSTFARESAEQANWIRSNTRTDDHILTNWGAALFLRTGRRTSIADPEESSVGPSLMDTPIRTYAGRLLTDSVDVYVLWDYAPGPSKEWMRSLQRRCPGLLDPVATDSTVGASRSLHYFRVRRELSCLRQLAGQTP